MSDGVLLVLDGFFFSSRRRHTRSKRDWSSDVCSSDLTRAPPRGAASERVGAGEPWPVARRSRCRRRTRRGGRGRRGRRGRTRRSAASWGTCQGEGPDVRAGEFGGDLEQKREHVAGLLGSDDRVYIPPGARELGVELSLVVGAHRLHGGGVRRLRGVVAEDSLDGRFA